MTSCISITTIYRGNYTTLLEPYACIPSRVKRILTANEMLKKHQPGKHERLLFITDECWYNWFEICSFLSEVQLIGSSKVLKGQFLPKFYANMAKTRQISSILALFGFRTCSKYKVTRVQFVGILLPRHIFRAVSVIV